ncbi:ABC transporter ATP-binding protein [Oscillatoria acuminata]|uniref:ABC-type multidrug transport system, ATPase and permease component n=1 Tax=Oscillatoria acuminata PCC 6304 TaxID=56110 RepID=K9TKQ2_9CYAN|nr:ABC transporter ATP-binding protein [Oscillatoria acuminata]AFY83120.1 ABC-type multidrug transport system, ATPase and permease component [Oscillatoria acuminata PCC 6304]
MTRLSPPPTPEEGRSRRRENDWRLFLRLVPYARRSGRLLGISLILLVPLAFAGAVQPIIIGQAISLIRGEPINLQFLATLTLPQGLNLLSGLLLLTITLRFALQAIQSYFVQEVGQKITADIRNDLFDHVTSLAVRFFDRTPVGRLITRLTSDVEALGEVFSTGAIGVITDLFSIAIVLIIMFYRQWQLALLLLLMLIPIASLIIYFQQQYRQENYKAREELSSLNSKLQENIVGVGVVQIFRREAFNAEIFRVNNQRYIKAVDKTIFYDSAVSATLEWIAFVAIAGVLWLGGQLVLGDSMTVGRLAEFILFSQRLFDPLRQFADKFTAIQAGFTAIERISDIFNETIEIRDPDVKERAVGAPWQGAAPENNSVAIADSNPHAGEIRFQNVSFAYKNDEYVLKNLDFTIKPGEKVALVGPTGAGKSSIVRLLCRLYEASQGQILVDGVNVRDMRQAELRQHIGVILQDGFLFAGDVKSNISLGETYTLAEIQSAAERTNVASFIEDLPQGYNTQLRERGTNLSGGQKQLLAFARAAIRNPKILVLDEATASLDVGTESLIQDALDHLLQDRTAIIIAHRLSTIKNVDRILVLKQGQLVEQGSHEELLQQGGLYAGLYQLQMLGK